MMLDFLGEMGSSFPWIYRGWIYLLSERYRKSRRDEWQRKGEWYRVVDIFFSLIFMLAEVALFYIAWTYTA